MALLQLPRHGIVFGGLVVMCWMMVTCSGQGVTWPPPPSWIKKAQMARYLVHNADWGIVSAMSPEFGMQPFGTLQSFSDGMKENSTGTPYFYIATISDTWKNINYNNTVSLSVTQAMSDYCSKQDIDPEEPICARVTLTGKVIKVQGNEVSFAKSILFKKHPAMKNWPKGHDWNFYKLKLTGVYLLDFYGGCTHVPLKDYFNAKTVLSQRRLTKEKSTKSLEDNSLVPGKV